jgi:CheY-like chemotaxis protein
MPRSRSALVVAATPSLAANLSAWLKVSGWQVVTATSYQEAKTRLRHHVDLLVTEVELGDYNGLHVVLRAQSQEIPAIVVGRQGEAFERDAEQFGSTYLSKENLNCDRFLVAVDVKLDGIRQATPSYRRDLEFVGRPWSVRTGLGQRRMLLH